MTLILFTLAAGLSLFLARSVLHGQADSKTLARVKALAPIPKRETKDRF